MDLNHKSTEIANKAHRLFIGDTSTTLKKAHRVLESNIESHSGYPKPDCQNVLSFTACYPFQTASVQILFVFFVNIPMFTTTKFYLYFSSPC